MSVSIHAPHKGNDAYKLTRGGDITRSIQTSLVGSDDLCQTFAD